MIELISKKVAIDTAIEAVDDWDGGYNLDREKYIREAFEALPSAQPKTQRLLDDGTLIVHTDIDITKITRVNIIQNNTHYGDLFYRDEE